MGDYEEYLIYLVDFYFDIARQEYRTEATQHLKKVDNWNKQKDASKKEHYKNEWVLLTKALAIIRNIIKNISFKMQGTKKILEPLNKFDRNFTLIRNRIYEASEDWLRSSRKENPIIQELKNIRDELIAEYQKNFYEIKIEINKKENPKLLEFRDKYQFAIDLYNDGNYKKAIQQARDVFAEELAVSFGHSTKKPFQVFKTAKETAIEYDFNNLIQSISNIRNNHCKTADKTPNEKLKAIAKLSIEQLINIRNYIEMTEKKEETNEQQKNIK